MAQYSILIGKQEFFLDIQTVNDSFKYFSSAVVLSLLVNTVMISQVPKMGELEISSQIPKKEEKVIYEWVPQKKVQKYIDTPDQPKVPVKQAEHISDKDSRADSSMQGPENGLMPDSKTKDLISQARRESSIPQMPSKAAMQKMQKQIEKMEKKQQKQEDKAALEDKTSVIEKKKKEAEETKKEKEIDMEEELSKISETPVSLAREPSPAKEDLFPLPMISIGTRTLSETGTDAFDAKGNHIGKYIRNMRDKIGLRFNQMVFFHYKANSIAESRVNIAFEIHEDGKVTNIQKENIKGDPLFAEYCETVVMNAQPFLRFTRDLEPFLEEGVLKMNILFGYNVRDSKNAEQ